MCTGAEVCTFVLSETEASRNGFILNVIMVFVLGSSLTHICECNKAFSHISILSIVSSCIMWNIIVPVCQSINQFISFSINPLQGVHHMDIEMELFVCLVALISIQLNIMLSIEFV